MKWKLISKPLVLGFLIALATTSTELHGQILITDMALPTTVISVVGVRKDRCYTKNTLTRFAGGAAIQAVLGSVGGSYASYLNGGAHAITNQLTNEQLEKCSSEIELYKITYKSPFDGKVHSISTSHKLVAGQTIKVTE